MIRTANANKIKQKQSKAKVSEKTQQHFHSAEEEKEDEKRREKTTNLIDLIEKISRKEMMNKQHWPNIWCTILIAGVLHKALHEFSIFVSFGEGSRI